MTKFFATFTALAALLFSPAAFAQATAFDGPLAELQRQSNALAQQMQQAENGIVGSNMSNPRIQALYRQYRAGGGPMDFRTWAYYYAATGGYTNVGKGFFYGNEAVNNYNENQARLRLRQAQQGRTSAMAQQQNQISRMQYERGLQLGGWQYRYTPYGYYWYPPY